MPENSAIKPTDDSSIHVESRQDKLKAWLAGQGLGLKQLSDRIGVSRQGVHNMLEANTVSPWRYAQLAALKIPAELLPLPELKRPGPKGGRCVGCGDDALNEVSEVVNEQG